MKLAVLPARKYFKWKLNPPADFDRVEAEFFTRLRLANRTFKTTSASRLADFNELIIRALPKSESPLNLLDVAISSGVTTIDFMDQLSQSEIELKMTATDLYIDADLLVFTPWFSVLVDHNGYPLQYEICGLGIRNWLSPRDYLRAFFLLVYAARAVHFLFKQWPLSPVTTKQKLISARVDQSRHNVHLQRDDIFETNPEYAAKFDLVRAPNILNLSYFSREKLCVAISNLGSRLKDGGILAICRTHPGGVNHGTLFRKISANRFEKIASLGAGSEVADLIAMEFT